MSSKTARDPWLDFLRAAAIIAVLVHHLAQEWPVMRPWLYPYTSLGAKGVDLFFVLSGWLIGGLFWRESQRSGKVDLPRFWARRWLRTLPPYAGGLALAWAAVWLYRSESFDAGYLIFIQNYYASMPFFFVSWSLCIEEHFYLFVPLLFYVLRQHPGWVLLLFAILPVIFRYLEYPIENDGFGYATTATHLRADGLLLGFAAAYVSVFHGSRFGAWRPVLMLAALGAAGLLVLDLGLKAEFVLDPLLIALVFVGLLIVWVDRSTVPWLRHVAVGWTAKISYSLYLTHALVIHAFVLGVFPWLDVAEPVAFSIAVAMVLVTGWIFYLAFERSAFILRERLAPAKTN